MTDLRTAAKQALEVLETTISSHGGMARSAIAALKAALEQPEQATGKEFLQVESSGRGQIATPLVLPTEVASELTTTDLAWLETRRLVRVWKELGRLRWVGADEGWDKAIEAVRARLDKECQDVLAWKEQVDASGETAKQVLQRMQGLKDD
jgi:hypothetical protein